MEDKKIENAKELARTAREKIRDFMTQDESKALPKGQLTLFYENIKTIYAELKGGTIAPREKRVGGMGRVILESWPMDKEQVRDLGDSIIAAENAYWEL